MIVYKSEHFSM